MKEKINIIRFLTETMTNIMNTGSIKEYTREYKTSKYKIVLKIEKNEED